MSLFIDLITETGTVTVQSYFQQLFNNKKSEAEEQFDDNLKDEVIVQLRKLNITFDTDEDFETYVPLHLTKVTITDTDTTMICHDATVEGGVVTDYGDILVKWKGDGYLINIVDPMINVTTFEK